MATVTKKAETAEHCYDSALSVFVMLVSRNVFQVVSALQCIVSMHFIHFFGWLDLLSAAFIVCGP